MFFDQFFSTKFERPSLTCFMMDVLINLSSDTEASVNFVSSILSDNLRSKFLLKRVKIKNTLSGAATFSITTLGIMLVTNILWGYLELCNVVNDYEHLMKFSIKTFSVMTQNKEWKTLIIFNILIKKFHGTIRRV